MFTPDIIEEGGSDMPIDLSSSPRAEGGGSAMDTCDEEMAEEARKEADEEKAGKATNEEKARAEADEEEAREAAGAEKARKAADEKAREEAEKRKRREAQEKAREAASSISTKAVGAGTCASDQRGASAQKKKQVCEGDGSKQKQTIRVRKTRGVQEQDQQAIINSLVTHHNENSPQENKLSIGQAVILVQVGKGHKLAQVLKVYDQEKAKATVRILCNGEELPDTDTKKLIKYHRRDQGEPFVGQAVWARWRDITPANCKFYIAQILQFDRIGATCTVRFLSDNKIQRRTNVSDIYSLARMEVFHEAQTLEEDSDAEDPSDDDKDEGYEEVTPKRRKGKSKGKGKGKKKKGKKAVSDSDSSDDSSKQESSSSSLDSDSDALMGTDLEDEKSKRRKNKAAEKRSKKKKDDSDSEDSEELCNTVANTLDAQKRKDLTKWAEEFKNSKSLELLSKIETTVRPLLSNKLHSD